MHVNYLVMSCLISYNRVFCGCLLFVTLLNINQSFIQVLTNKKVLIILIIIYRERYKYRHICLINL